MNPFLTNQEEEFDFDDVVIHRTDIAIKNDELQYLLFDFSKKVGEDSYEHLYKAISLVKLKRIPKKDITLTAFLDMQSGIVTGYYQNQINFIQIIANICKPYKHGLIFAYGVQGTSSNSIEEAKADCDTQMAALKRTITGSYRTLEYQVLSGNEAQWIYKNLGKMDQLRILRGVPSTKNSGARTQAVTFMGATQKDAEEQSEEFLLAMDDYEYMMVLTATRVEPFVISKWKEAHLKESTYWSSINKGQKSVSFGLSMPMTFASNIGASQGWGSSTGQSYGENYGTNISHSTGTSDSTSQGVSTSDSISTSNSYSQGTSHSVGTSVSESYGENYGESLGYSEGVSIGQSHNIGTNQGYSSGISNSFSTSNSVSTTDGYNNGISGGSNFGYNQGSNTGGSSNSGYNVGANIGFNGSVTESQGTSYSDSSGINAGGNSGWSQGTSHSVSSSTGYGTSTSTNEGTSFGISEGFGNSYGESYSNSYGQSYGTSHSISVGQTISTGTSESWSTGTGTSKGVGTSESVSHGVSTSTSTGSSHGTSYGTNTGSSLSGGSSSGLSSSMGLGPSLSFGKSFSFEDREISHIIDLLNFSTQRLIQASTGLGMWFTDCYIACENEEAAATATSAAMTAWHGKNVLTSPLQVYAPNKIEKDYLMKHMSVFSPSTKREGVPGQYESYKYSTMLLSDELSAYSHPPRINIGGIQASVDDPPVLSITNERQNGNIFLGYIADTEKYSMDRGYKSQFKYTLRSDELHHAYISGASRSGKTVVARRLVAETYKNVRRGEKQKKMRFVIMDPKQDWRALAKVIPPENFRFYSLSDPTFHPVKLNLMKIPHGVYTERYADKLREIFIRSYGLGDRGFQILGKVIRELYKEAGCFNEDAKFNKPDPITGKCLATERSKNITMEDVYIKLYNEIEELKANAMKGGREKAEASQRILDRIETFGEPTSSIYTIFCNRGDEGMGLDELLGADDVIVLESYGMDTVTSAFIFGLITSGIYQYAVSNGGFVNPPDQYETVLVIEEANQVLISDDKDNMGGANPFEVILDQSAGYGLFIWTITQKISDMPRSVLANSAIKIIGRQDDENDIQKTIVQIGKDANIADRVFKNWLPDQPTGWFIIKSSRNRDFTKNAPIHVLVEYLNVEPPTNDELDALLKESEYHQLLNKLETKGTLL